MASMNPNNIRSVAQIRPFVLAAAFILSFLSVSGILLTYPLAKSGYVDFRHLYTAGYMARTGQADKIYDEAANKRLQDRLVSPAEGTLTFNHLAYESLIYVPFSFLGYRKAYLVFFLVNLIVLAICVRMLWPYLFPLEQIWRYLPVAAVVCFLPVSIALIEGQDSLILLALLIATTIALDSEKEFRAGVLLGLTLFKFQYAVPIAVLFLFWRRWRFLGGFAVCALLFSGVSMWLTGLSGASQFVHYILSMSHNPTGANGGKYGIHPDGMANIRGLVTVNGAWLGHYAMGATLALSAIALAWSALKRASLPLALLAALLVSFHQTISDTSLAVLPMGLLLVGWVKPMHPRGTLTGALAGALFLAPPVLLFANTRFFLLGIPLFLLFAYWDGTYWSPFRDENGSLCPQKVTA